MIAPLLSLGASGVISVWSNVAPQTVHNLVAYWHDGNPQKAREIQLANLRLGDEVDAASTANHLAT